MIILRWIYVGDCYSSLIDVIQVDGWHSYYLAEEREILLLKMITSCWNLKKKTVMLGDTSYHFYDEQTKQIICKMSFRFVLFSFDDRLWGGLLLFTYFFVFKENLSYYCQLTLYYKQIYINIRCNVRLKVIISSDITTLWVYFEVITYHSRGWVILVLLYFLFIILTPLEYLNSFFSAYNFVINM